MAKGVTRGIVEIEGQHGLVYLYPCGTGVGKGIEHTAPGGQECIEECQRVAAIDRLGEAQEGDRAEQHRTCDMSRRDRFAIFAHHLAGPGRERLARRYFGDDVVVVGVEPLGHFQRRQVDVAVLPAACHGEVAGQRIEVVKRPVAFRNGVHHDRGIEHVVVKRKIVHRNAVGTRVPGERPVPRAQCTGDIEQFFGADVSLPMTFERALQLAAATDTGKTGVGDVWHDCSSSQRKRREGRLVA